MQCRKFRSFFIVDCNLINLGSSAFYHSSSDKGYSFYENSSGNRSYRSKK